MNIKQIYGITVSGHTVFGPTSRVTQCVGYASKSEICICMYTIIFNITSTNHPSLILQPSCVNFPKYLGKFDGDRFQKAWHHDARGE